MKNRVVRVIKKSEEARTPNVPVAVNSSEAVANIQNDIVQTVNDWVSEWREKSRSEKTASDGTIKAWNQML